MPALSVPRAIMFKMECDNGRKAQGVVELEGREVTQVVYLVSKHLVEASGRYAKNVWIEEYNVIYDVPLNRGNHEARDPSLYRLS